MATRITSAEPIDIRFPTSTSLIGSDAMNHDPDYSAAYLILRTDDPRGPAGHGLTFTIGRGTEICVAAIEALVDRVVGLELEGIVSDMGGFWRHVTGDSQLRWLGPEKGVIHLATAAVVNAIWDLYAKSRGKPLWKLLTDMTPDELVACIDFRYLTDYLTAAEAVDLLTAEQTRRGERQDHVRDRGIPAYTTSVGWLGYPDEKLRALCRQAINAGWSRFKLKVGASLEDDLRRASVIREEIGSEALLMMDANQRWDVPEAIACTRELTRFDPLWMEEPTSPDDILGHAAIAEGVHPVAVATGEHVQNRIVFKQLLAASAIGYCQIDACRLGGVNEALAVILMAAKAGVPICPHTGGVGLAEFHQHLSIFDYVALGGDLDGRFLEYTDHLHEHFLDPVSVADGRYRVPHAPGCSLEMHSSTRDRFRFPSQEPDLALHPDGQRHLANEGVRR